MAQPSVLVTFDSMKDTNRGYFSFGKGLGNALIQENQNKFRLTYYLAEHTDSYYLFNGTVNILPFSRWHRIFFPSNNKYDIVHLSDQFCRLRPNKVSAKRIMTVHDMNKVHLKYSKPRRIKAYLKKLGGFISQCDKVVAISKFVANDLLTYFPEAAHKISVIYNGADKLVVPDNHQPVYIPKKSFLFTIGLLSVQKGFHFLPCLLEDNNYELVISGIETPHKSRIIEEAEKFGCRDRVIITGPIAEADKAWYYKNCSAFLFPSIAEGFGLPVIEVMHFGKPVFLSKYTSLPEVGGDAAYYFDDFEPLHMQQIFAKGMKDFNNHMRADEIINQANKFSWEQAAQQYLKLYQACL
ncbi:MAG: glycosyltransferase family 4 protein [Janthinobacterium lividum]